MAGSLSRSEGIALGLILNRVFGSVPSRSDIAATFRGWGNKAADKVGADPAWTGAFAAVAGTGAAVAMGPALRSMAVATAAATADQSTQREGRLAGQQLAIGDVQAAARTVEELSGRSLVEVTAGSVARLAIETIASDTVTNLVAPALWAGVGGAAGLGGYKLARRADFLVGRSSGAEGPALISQIDDVALWLPARLAALLVAVAKPTKAAAVLSAVRQGPPAGHPSPNLALAQAAFGAALGVQLGGDMDQTGVEPVLSLGAEPGSQDVEHGLQLADRMELLLTGGLLSASALRRVRNARITKE
ncbi:MAG: cobalamin biosynthesis protein [Actinobacteria bacterium]|nr:cobalamin biosynthesis protein [Actinomycetota bacterium]